MRDWSFVPGPDRRSSANSVPIGVGVGGPGYSSLSGGTMDVSDVRDILNSCMPSQIVLSGTTASTVSLFLHMAQARFRTRRIFHQGWMLRPPFFPTRI